MNKIIKAKFRKKKVEIKLLEGTKKVGQMNLPLTEGFLKVIKKWLTNEVKNNSPMKSERVVGKKLYQNQDSTASNMPSLSEDTNKFVKSREDTKRGKNEK